MDAEQKRLLEDKEKKAHWRRWGSYLSERQWGTVREDYSEDGDAWSYITYEKARTTAYKWGEDGIGGLSDNHGRLCFAFCFWNGKDDHIKERLFGLSNPEGNHGEDIKEVFFYLDNTPTHSFMRYLYKLPHAPFPYDDLRKTNQKRTQKEREYELNDTGVLDNGAYCDMQIEYAKFDPDDIAIRLIATNRSESEEVSVILIPKLWCRAGIDSHIAQVDRGRYKATLPEMMLYAPEELSPIFAENATGKKQALSDAICQGDLTSINKESCGTILGLPKCVTLKPKESTTLYFRLSSEVNWKDPLKNLEKIFKQREKEAETFYQNIQPKTLCAEYRNLQKQAFAGMLWNKQYYNYVVETWLKDRIVTRNSDWLHLFNDDILSVPDKWEYPAFFSWDTAFHTLPLALLDAEFAKRQLYLLTREWYMHPSGQLPAYEWNFNDVNPPVHAWACYRVYKIEKKQKGKGDTLFLERAFQKLLLNFTWWVNRKDVDGKNIFQGGFLGLDNISVFNRSEDLPPGSTLYQSDATSWMGMSCLNMLTIALELAKTNPSYEDMASKFYEHFLFIADAINFTDSKTHSLWNEEDGFYYDLLIQDGGDCQPIKVRSLVGLIPLLAVTTITPELLDQMKGFKKRMDWFINHRPDLCSKLACMKREGEQMRRILSLVSFERLERLLKTLLNEEEFLSPYGIRSISKYHEKHPFKLKLDGHEYSVDYEPAESTLKLFGGNSNWRGPIWFPINILLIESLQKFHHYLGDEFKVECPTGSGHYLTLWEVAVEISKRLLKIFEKREDGTRPLYGEQSIYQNDPHFQDLFHFHEYFNGDTGEGLGASHQTGWTGLIAKLIQQLSAFGHI